MKWKPKKCKKFDCPTIITTNPEELNSVPQQFPEDFYDFLKEPLDDVSMSCFEDIWEETNHETEMEPEDHAIPINDRKSKRHDNEDNEEIPHG